MFLKFFCASENNNNRKDNNEKKRKQNKNRKHKMKGNATASHTSTNQSFGVCKDYLATLKVANNGSKMTQRCLFLVAEMANQGPQAETFAASYFAC